MRRTALRYLLLAFGFLACAAGAAERFQKGPVNDAGENTVLDTKTKRKWMMEDFGKEMEFDDANHWCGTSNRVREWRLPTQAELASLRDPKLSVKCGDATCQVSPLLNLTGSTFWTSERGKALRPGWVNLATGEKKLLAQGEGMKRAICIAHK